MVHCFAIASLMGRPGADRFIDHGMKFLWDGHRDAKHGGYFWGVGENGPSDPLKQAYGHAFVLLAASSAKIVGHPDADRLIADIGEVLRDRFWELKYGAVRRGVLRRLAADQHLSRPELQHASDRSADGRVRGDRRRDLARDGRERRVARHRQLAKANGWRVAEHFDENWQLDRDYSNGDVFRPYGTTPGHSLEWTRLLLQLWELGGRRLAWLPDAAKALFAKRRRTDGTRTVAASTTRSTGTAGRACATASGGRRRRGSARRRS